MYLGWVAGARPAPRRAAAHRRAACPNPLCLGAPRAGPILLIAFSLITWYYSIMLVDAYRYPNVDGPTRNYTYIRPWTATWVRAPRPAPPRPAPAAPPVAGSAARAPPPRLNLPQLMRGAQAGRT